ncbi:hypothetical protein V865_003426 [Kwoniella europaea PYCC6329]|uniref:Fe2OG dioxygenase domain-containing protein n=1 Tax=Kwoniella europaea PYCC6329 TaxID=1423913 RepID=A0AAX4KH35_9TREE
MTVIQEYSKLPVISLRDHKSVESLAQQLNDVCTTEGFMYVKDHGIPQELIDKAFAIAGDYFANAGPQDKVELKDNIGYTAMRKGLRWFVLSLDSTRGSGDLKECFHLANPDWLQLHDEQMLLPPILEPSRSTMESFISQINCVAHRLLEGLSVSLHLAPDYLSSQHLGERNRLRLLHYPPASLPLNTTEDSKSADIRAGAHTDYGSITVLFQSSVSGLQVRRGSSWVDVPPKPGCLVINIGDALEFWSGGAFKSTLHRVVMPRNLSETTSRYSIAYFLHPDNESVLQPLGGQINDLVLDEILVRKGMKAGVRKIKGGEYVQARLDATYGKKE